VGVTVTVGVTLGAAVREEEGVELDELVGVLENSGADGGGECVVVGEGVVDSEMVAVSDIVPVSVALYEIVSDQETDCVAVTVRVAEGDTDKLCVRLWVPDLECVADSVMDLDGDAVSLAVSDMVTDSDTESVMDSDKVTLLDLVVVIVWL